MVKNEVYHNSNNHIYKAYIKGEPGHPGERGEIGKEVNQGKKDPEVIE